MTKAVEIVEQFKNAAATAIVTAVVIYIVAMGPFDTEGVTLRMEIRVIRALSWVAVTVQETVGKVPAIFALAILGFGSTLYQFKALARTLHSKAGR